MVVALHHHQLIRIDSFVGHVPRFPRPAEADAFPQADGVEGKPDVLAEDLSFSGLYWAGHAGQIAIEKLAERPLADEADAGRVLLRVDRQARLARDASHLGFLHLAHRKYHARELVLGMAMQEVALIFCIVCSPEKAK